MHRQLLCITLLAATAVVAAESALDQNHLPAGSLPSMREWRLVSSASDDGVLVRSRSSLRALSPPPDVTVNGAACADPPLTVILDPGVAKRFRTPGYPTEYSNGVSCGWNFESYNGRPLDLRCASVALAADDFLNFYDVTSGEWQSISDISGVSISESFSGGRVEASFQSDSSGTAKGFLCVIWSSTSASSPTIPWDSTLISTDIFATATTPTTASAGIPATTTTIITPPSSTSTTIKPVAVPSCQCGRKLASRIVGGQPATENEYPWMVSIGVGWNGQFCGGALISDRWIVTAAHCIDEENVQSPGGIRVGLGYYQLTSPLSSSITRTARQIIRHPSYSEVTFANDIALIRVDPINWARNPSIRPACLPDNANDLYSGSTGIVTGWGTTSSGGSSSDKLMEVSIPIISNSACGRHLRETILSVMMCAGADAGGVDSCQGDSGGPMVVMDGANAELVGVVSWGYGCAKPQSPGVYTRVTEFLSWIQKSTSGSEYCPRK